MVSGVGAGRREGGRAMSDLHASMLMSAAGWGFLIWRQAAQDASAQPRLTIAEPRDWRSATTPRVATPNPADRRNTLENLDASDAERAPALTDRGLCNSSEEDFADKLIIFRRGCCCHSWHLHAGRAACIGRWPSAIPREFLSQLSFLDP